MSEAVGTATSVDVEATKKQGFFSTQQGRLVAIVGGLLVLGITAGVGAAIILNTVSGESASDDPVSAAPPASTETTGSTSGGASIEAATPASEVANSEVFTFRNIFEPLIKPAPEPSAPSTATPSATDTETPYARGVLYLDGVVTEDGILKAELRYSGTAYTLGPGEGIPGTPWEVLRVSSTSVTMLYGDIQVTLAVGQGITK